MDASPVVKWRAEMAARLLHRHHRQLPPLLLSSRARWRPNKGARVRPMRASLGRAAFCLGAHNATRARAREGA